MLRSAVSMAGDIAGAATALAGLILVYLGGIAASYGAYGTVAQSDIRSSFRWRAWWAAIGVLIALSAAALALTGKWLGDGRMVLWGFGALMLAFIWGGVSAILTASEIE